MIHYILKRLLLIIPTLLGIMLLNFLLIQLAPGGPVERTLLSISGEQAPDLGSRFTRSDNAAEGGQRQALTASGAEGRRYRGAEGLNPQIIARIEEQFGFDKPIHERFLLTLYKFITFNFGKSYFSQRPVVDMIVERIPISVALGFLGLFLSYLISIPLGIAKAQRDARIFDRSTTLGVIVVDAIPNFALAIFFLAFFAVNLKIFPLGGLTSDDFDQFTLWGKIKDLAWHLTLPVLAFSIGGYSALTFLTKNSFLDQLRSQYVITARAKGLSKRQVMYGHVFRNAMLLVISGFPAAVIGLFFTGSVLLERIFSINGMGLLGLDAISSRDYPVILATTYIFGLMALVLQIVTDITYMLVDPRITFEARKR